MLNVTPPSETKQRKKKLSSHRLLTSEEIISVKMEAAELKLQKEKEKENKKRIKAEKQTSQAKKKRN